MKSLLRKIRSGIQSILRHDLFPYFSTVIVLILIIFLYQFFFSPNINGLKDGVFENLVAGLIDVFTIFLLFSIIQYRILKRREKRDTIKRLLEELEDYKGWTETEAAYRVSGIVRRLNKNDVTEINLADLHGGKLKKNVIQASLKNETKFASLENAQLEEIDLSQTKIFTKNLNNCNLDLSNLENTDFYKLSLRRVSFFKSNLKGANLADTDLTESSFGFANLEGANLYNSNLKNCQLFSCNLRYANLNKANLVGAKILNPSMEKFYKKNEFSLYMAFLPEPNMFTNFISKSLTELDNAIVSSEDWLIKFAEYNPIFVDSIQNFKLEPLKEFEQNTIWWNQEYSLMPSIKIDSKNSNPANLFIISKK